MSKPIFVLDDTLIVTAPVHIQVPQSSRATGGRAQQQFVIRTAYVDFRIPTEDELDAVLDEANRANEQLAKRITEAEKDAREAADDDSRVAAERKLADLRREVRIGQVEQLKVFIAGLPDGHGFAEADGSSCVFSPELIGRLCQYRAVRTALWNAFLLILNGDPKKGN